MNHTPLHPPAEALDALALGALPDAEALEVREHVAGCPECAAHVAAVTATLAQLPLALAPVAPSAGAKARLLDRVAADAPPPIAMPTPVARRPWLPWLAAAAAAVIGLGIGGWLAFDAQRDADDAVARAVERAEEAEERATARTGDLDDARDRVAALAADLETQRAEAYASLMLLSDEKAAVETLRADVARRAVEVEQLADRLAEQEQFARQMTDELAETRQIVAALQSGGAAFVSLGPTDAADADEAARVLLDTEGGRWYLFTANLPDLPPEQEYQFWLVDADTAPASAGLFRVGPDGRGLLSGEIPANLADFEAAAITPEPAGGSDAPTGDIRLLAELK